MSNILNEEKQQQIIVLGQLGWSLRRIEQQTGVRRETARSWGQELGSGPSITTIYFSTEAHDQGLAFVEKGTGYFSLQDKLVLC